MDNSMEEVEFRFFDAHEEMPSVSGTSSSHGVDPSFPILNISGNFSSDAWIGTIGNARERRNQFLNWMGVDENQFSHDNSVNAFPLEEPEVCRTTENSGAVLRTASFEDKFSSSRSSVSSSSHECISDLDASGLRVNYICSDENSANASEKIRAGGSEWSKNEMEADIRYEASPCFRGKEVEKQRDLGGIMKRVKKKWFSGLNRANTKLISEDSDANGVDVGRGNQRIKVKQHKKQSKELSALYVVQEIQAHEGSILSMKFSPDGRLLASAGADGVLRVWNVVEDERSNEHDIPEIDPSCMYFEVNDLSELKPLMVEKEKSGKLNNSTKTSDSACVIFPPKVFRVLEQPLHEFRGHSGDILDISWSKNNRLLSASVDKTVRLWQIGHDDCLGVFTHCNYVTSVQFNPMDDRFFISGSIDGKVRIWSISSCQVVDWADVRDIVTAVCYRPDGQGTIVGTLSSNCRFYSISDNHLQLDARICLQSKKKSSSKRITAFEFCPKDPSKVMVVSADSKVRIVQGHNVVGKYKGVGSAGNQISASFTSDGKHIVSASDDSNIYMWNCTDQARNSQSQMKKIRSCERFSSDASVVAPWCGFQYEDGCSTGVSDPSWFSLGKEFVLESPHCSATWPEEKLSTPPFSPRNAIRKSQHRFLKQSCQSTTSSHAWGLVIVTGGRDGRIRSFHNYGLPVPI